MDDIVLNKAAAIERCVRRVRQEHAGQDANLEADITKQDSIILNIQRACEASIDLAMHLVRIQRLGIPQDSREAFDMLRTANVIDEPTASRLKAMVGFRNVAMHDYQALNLEIVKAIVATHLDELAGFAQEMVRKYS